MLDAFDCEERAIPDKVYQHGKYKAPKTVLPEGKQLFQQIRATHETCNAWFAIFGILQQMFCHDVSLHGVLFHVVAKITHLMVCHDSF